MCSLSGTTRARSAGNQVGPSVDFGLIEVASGMYIGIYVAWVISRVAGRPRCCSLALRAVRARRRARGHRRIAGRLVRPGRGAGDRRDPGPGGTSGCSPPLPPPRLSCSALDSRSLPRGWIPAAVKSGANADCDQRGRRQLRLCRREWTAGRGQPGGERKSRRRPKRRMRPGELHSGDF